MKYLIKRTTLYNNLHLYLTENSTANIEHWKYTDDLMHAKVFETVPDLLLFIGNSNRSYFDRVNGGDSLNIAGVIENTRTEVGILG